MNDFALLFILDWNIRMARDYIFISAYDYIYAYAVNS